MDSSAEGAAQETCGRLKRRDLFTARFCLSSVTTRLRAWLLTAGASRLISSPIRSKHEAANHCQTSLEEAAVRRPGR